MRTRIVLIGLVCVALTAAPAHADGRQRGIYAGVLTALGAVVLGCLASGIALRYEAPGAPTLMVYKREASASDDLLIGGAIALAPTVVFAALGGALFSLGPDTHRRVSLAPSSTGATLGWTVSF
jgi:hypothetical protein